MEKIHQLLIARNSPVIYPRGSQTTQPGRSRGMLPSRYRLFMLALVLICVAGAGRAQAIPHAPAAQPTGLAARHRSGQTFLTWQEQPGANLRYRVYRHTAAIDAANLTQATLLFDGVPQDSGRFYANRYNVQASGVWDERYVARFVVEDGGPQLAAGVGLLVWTLAPVDFGGGQSGAGYYAVNTVDGGDENRTDFGPGNTVGPVAESVADPLPVEISAPGIDPGGHIFVQYMPLRDWNVTFHAPNPGNIFYGLDETSPAVVNAIQYAYDYAVYAPGAADCGGALPAALPVVVSLHGWDGNSYGPRTADPDPYGWCAYRIYPIDQSETWWFGFARNHDYRSGGTPGADDVIANFTERRVLRMVYDLLRDPPGPSADANRVFIFGSSMGGSGALAFALRYPNVFAAAYAGQPMTNYATSGDGGGLDWRSDLTPKWGAVAADLPVIIAGPGDWADALHVHNGVGVWTWPNHQAQAVAQRGLDTVPLGIAHGVADDVIEWSTQGQPIYPALNAAQHVWGGAAVPGGHSWTGFGGSLYNLDQDFAASWAPFQNFAPRRDETVPGLSNGSANAPLTPPQRGRLQPRRALVGRVGLVGRRAGGHADALADELLLPGCGPLRERVRHGAAAHHRRDAAARAAFPAGRRRGLSLGESPRERQWAGGQRRRHGGCGRIGHRAGLCPQPCQWQPAEPGADGGSAYADRHSDAFPHAHLLPAGNAGAALGGAGALAHRPADTDHRRQHRQRRGGDGDDRVGRLHRDRQLWRVRQPGARHHRPAAGRDP
jgi:hypothetical protein